MTREPGSPLTRPSAVMVAEARASIENITVADAAALLERDDVLFVDIRDPRELARLGTIPGSFRAPRGMLEFWVDPASPYYKPALDSGQKLVLFCGSGWRSALTAKTLQEMGLDNVAHLDGGFTAWQEAGQPVETV
ncbi:rhodanese-like domain-containing protein [Propioniciclava sinopodophylli]|uniref:Rhodanese-like domain-containing protein n=1 Tax=Propioniciclava sinopodophylli TaxID=1837344 RepID=A0A4Q9KC39_9ACTN|nr:rhodanese-like domain-containing protein [Propioniciclava sinopodophylli]TBT83515.1 rhodanese-like domain-containing protein [Propioniciclava sinopodophylli]